MHGSTHVRGSARGRLTAAAATAAATAACAVALAGCSPVAPAPAPAATSTGPRATATVRSPEPGSTESGPGAPITLPTETADPLTPVKPAPTATQDPGTVAGACERTQAAYPVVSPGARGPAVAALQCFLNDADFGPVKVDGVYGAQTQAAMARVEATYEGPAPKPGRVDAGVWVLVISRAMGTETLKVGSKGADVATLQRALRAAGGTITVDGVFGPATKKVVQRFQDANRIGADGVVGDETLFLLKSGATIG